MVSLLGSSSVGFAGAGFPRDFPHVCPLHTCPCTRSPCTPGHLVFSRQPQQSLFCSRSAPFGRGSDSSSTESKQLPFRGSKYFAMCYFSVIYYEGIFSLLSQDLTTLQSHQTWPWLCKGRLHLCFPPCHFGGTQGGVTQPWLPSGTRGCFAGAGISPCSFKAEGHLGWEIWFNGGGGSHTGVRRSCNRNLSAPAGTRHSILGAFGVIYWRNG